MPGRMGLDGMGAAAAGLISGAAFGSGTVKSLGVKPEIFCNAAAKPGAGAAAGAACCEASKRLVPLICMRKS